MFLDRARKPLKSSLSLVQVCPFAITEARIRPCPGETRLLYVNHVLIFAERGFMMIASYRPPLNLKEVLAFHVNPRPLRISRRFIVQLAHVDLAWTYAIVDEFLDNRAISC
jgi:hypothetical protein